MDSIYLKDILTVVQPLLAGGNCEHGACDMVAPMMKSDDDAFQKELSAKILPELVHHLKRDEYCRSNALNAFQTLRRVPPDLADMLIEQLRPNPAAKELVADSDVFRLLAKLLEGERLTKERAEIAVLESFSPMVKVGLANRDRYNMTKFCAASLVAALFRRSSGPRLVQALQGFLAPFLLLVDIDEERCDQCVAEGVHAIAMKLEFMENEEASQLIRDVLDAKDVFRFLDIIIERKKMPSIYAKSAFKMLKGGGDEGDEGDEGNEYKSENKKHKAN